MRILLWWLAGSAALMSCRSAGTAPRADLLHPTDRSEPESQEPETALSLDQAMQITSNGGTYLLSCVVDPLPPAVNEFFEMRVLIAPAPGKELDGLGNLQLFADADMPEHGHGMNTMPEVERLADGSFRVDGMMFHMFGFWEIDLDITRDGKTERAQLELTLE